MAYQDVEFYVDKAVFYRVTEVLLLLYMILEELRRAARMPHKTKL